MSASISSLPPAARLLVSSGRKRKNPEAAWDEATVTTFGYKNYGVRSEQHRYIVYADGSEELYDHTKDKWEWDNLAGNSDYAEVMEKLRKEIPSHHEPSGVTYKVPKRKR